MTVAYAISRADLVIIPIQGSQLDAAEGAKAIRLIKQQEKAFRRTILFAILFTRTNAAIRPRTLLHIQQEFHKRQIHSLETQLHEREAYRALFSFGGTLETLDPSQVGNLEKAVQNAREYVSEVVALLRAGEEKLHQQASEEARTVGVA